MTWFRVLQCDGLKLMLLAVLIVVPGIWGIAQWGVWLHNEPIEATVVETADKKSTACPVTGKPHVWLWTHNAAGDSLGFCRDCSATELSPGFSYYPESLWNRTRAPWIPAKPETLTFDVPVGRVFMAADDQLKPVRYIKLLPADTMLILVPESSCLP